MKATQTARAVPLFTSLRGYRTDWLGSDVSAGLAVAAVALPIGVAYPALAGLPAQTGLYASIAALLAYAAFGPSRQLIIGPDAATLTVLAAVLAAIFAAPGTTADPAAVAALLAVAVGVLCLVARVLTLGVLANFLSPILVGFFAGISLSIIVGQIGRLTGVAIESDELITSLLELARKAGAIHWPSLALGAACFSSCRRSGSASCPSRAR